MSERRLSILGGVFLAVLAAGLLGAYDASLGVILQGGALGVGTGLMAVGLVLIYRTTRVINFAYGAMGTLAGAVATSMKLGPGVNWFVAAVVAVVIGVIVGLVVELLVIRRFATSPRLVLTVATIGLAQALGGLALYIPRWFDAPALNPGFDTQLSSTQVKISPVTLNGNHLVLAAVAPIVLALLSWFLFRTDAGTAVRGMADNLDRARLVGIPVDRLDLLLWGVAGALAAITVVLRAPTQGLSVDAAAGPTLLLAPLAAAVIVGMRSIVGAFLVGVAIEIIDQLVQINLSSRTWTSVALLILIVAGLLLQQSPEGRADGGGGTWSTVGVAKALPAKLAALPEVRALRVVLGLVVLAAVVVVPLVGSPSQIRTATVAVIFGLAALSLLVLTGWGGVVSLGQWALVGVGGVITANLIADLDLDLFLTMILSALGAGVVAALIGLPALRVSGELLAVTTLAFAVAMQVHVINPATYPGLVPSDYERPLLWNRIDLRDEEALYALSVVTLAAVAFVIAGVRRTRSGRVIQATRDNPRASAAAGVGSVRTKLTAFVVSGMIAGVAGTLHAVTLQGLGTNTYNASDSLLLFSMAVIGGIASIGGVLAAVALIEWLGYAFPDIQLLLTGVGLLVILLIIPGGLGQAFERVRDRFARAVARRRGVEVVEDLDAVDLTDATPEQEAAAAAVAAERADREAAAHDASQAGFTPVVDATDALFACSGVETGYGSLQVLFGVDLSVRQGDVLALLGTNGAGKSTFFRTGLNLLPTWAGRVTFDGTDITKMAPERIARLGLSLMPGGKGLFTSLTVGENLRLSTWMLRGDRERAAARTEEMLDLFPVLRDRWEQQAGTLSGGEQQQLSLAMAFVTEPKLVFIDELSLGLAPTIVGMLVEKVKQLHQQGTTVVVVEQSINVALLMCDEAMFLEKGQVRFRGPTSGLLERPDILRAVFLGAVDDEQVLPPPDERETRGVTLECHGVTKTFGGITAVDDVDLTVAPGRIVGLIGHNGAGKTTLFDVLTGFLPLDGGTVHLDGRDISGLPPHQRAILEVGRSFQEALLYPSLTVEETVLVALERHLANRDPVAAAFRLPASVESEFHARQRSDELLELLGLDAFRDHITGELSTGTRRIVELACLLAQDPAVILLDEPTAGVAQAETEALVPLLRRIQSETGCSMVVIEHDMGLLSSLCDEFVALEQGRIIARGTPADVLADPAVVASYLGTDDAVVHRSGERL